MRSGQAAKSYNEPNVRGGSPRESEARALLEAARRMAEAQRNPDDMDAVIDSVRLNWRLWTIFQAELAAPDCQVPHDIRQNMLNLCNFIDKRTVEILSKQEANLLDALISINRNIASGLLTDPNGADAPDDGGHKGGDETPQGLGPDGVSA